MRARLIHGLTSFSVDHPWLVIGLTLGMTIAFGLQLPKMTTDTDPKHMLPMTSPVRQYNDQVEREFGLHADNLVVGIVNERGVVNSRTLSHIADLTRQIQKIPGVVVRDVTSFPTIDNVAVEGGDLTVHPLLGEVPISDKDLDALRTALLENPLLRNRVISGDTKATAIYVPLEPSANGREIAGRIREMLPKSNSGDQFFLAGDPIARDTFGYEMFQQMALFSPIAGMVMCLALWLMFRSWSVVIANMAVAMISIICAMGLFIGLGFPVHIMSSMSPVFLMAIATDSVHIFNEFAFRYGEVNNKRRAVLETMAAVGRPVVLSDLTTAAGFASLATGSIVVPVRVFGLLVGFGTLVILLMSFTLVPAILILMRERRIAAVAKRECSRGGGGSPLLAKLGSFCVRRAKPVALAGCLLLVVAGVGLARIRVNNNMVHWFKSDSDIRIADRVLNQHLGGTSTGYVVVQGSGQNAMHEPEMLRTIESLQRELEKDPLVGKTHSVVDFVKRINRVLHNDDPAFDRVPDSAAEIAQYLFLFSMSAKPTDLNNVVDYPFQKANLMVQLKSWDAGVMQGVMDRANAHLKEHPLPGGATVRPAGIAYFNLVWNDEVLWGMVTSFMSGLVFVLVLLVIEMRSLRWGLLSFVPLLFTIAMIYGMVGLAGKDFDMPVAVLSTLSLGLAIDFAVHFVGRFQQHYATSSKLDDSLVWTVARPGKGIFRNAVLFALGFVVMVFAHLTPYITVGVLMAAIMLLSSISTVALLPALVRIFDKRLLKGRTT
ncbi:MAG: MMPL family transporter [Acidobacteria bacterium]|nr:MMPL family transporter [Acidobacteriota bacterium]